MKKPYLLLLPLIALIAAFLSWWHQQQPMGQQPIVLPLAQDCQLHSQTCETHYQQHPIRLSITPHPIPVAKTLTINAELTGLAPIAVQLDINGSNMYMGYNRVALHPQGNDLWTGKSLLSFCTIDQMQWQLTLLIDLPNGQQIQAPFPLTTPDPTPR